jgi:hypothetical protein
MTTKDAESSRESFERTEVEASYVGVVPRGLVGRFDREEDGAQFIPRHSDFRGAGGRATMP